MSNIAKTGPKGYEYQYQVSLLIALHQISNQKTELYIENVGIEDAFLKICKGHSIQNIEIQVKREEKLLALETLTQWLYHFEERGSNQNLLQKIIDGSIALFVTQSRCSDDTYMFKKDISDYESHQPISYSKSWKEDFLKYLSENSFSSNSTSLTKKRNELCQKQRDSLSRIETLKETIRRVVIWEEINHSRINQEIEAILNQKFKIPQSLSSSIRRELYEKIPEGRDSGKDVIPSIEYIIQKSQPSRPLLDEEKYLVRSMEKELKKKLSKDKLLLLTGHSFCGKTILAKKIASHFFDNGFSYKITGDIQLLEEFFSQNVDENKIAILEDVWGHIEVKESFYEIKRKIEQLVGSLHKHHKLIITSRKEILQEALHDGEKIAQHEWHDLTISENEDLIKYWINFTSRKDFPTSIVNIFSEYLSHSINEPSLQIGEVEYLSNYNIEDLEDRSLEEMLHIARHQSKDIALHLKRKNNNAARFLSILALCTDTIQPVRIEGFAYILYGESKYYSVVERDVSSIDLNDKGKEYYVNKYFKYENLYHLTDDDLSLLDFLEERGFIEIIYDDKIIFTHPNYYEAGRHLLFRSSSRQQNYLLECYKRTLSCIDPKITHLAANQMSIIINKLQLKNVSKILNISDWIYGSVFPATKDVSLIFRITNFERLSIDLKKSLEHEIYNDGSYFSKIDWHNEIPFIKNHLEVSDLQRDLFYQVNTDPIKNKFKEHNHISIKEAYDLLKCHDGTISIDVFQFLFKFNEGFIRHQAAVVYFSSYAKLEDECFIDLIFEDSHPTVIYAAIKGCFLGWMNYSKGLQDVLIEKLKIAIDNRIVSIRLLDLMTTFGVDYTYDSIWRDDMEDSKIEIWKLWGALFPIFAKQLPTEIMFNSGRFCITMDSAIKYLSSKDIIKILNAWYEVIDRDKTGFWSIDSYGSSIMDYLVKFSKNDWQIRILLFEKLISHRNTSFVITSISWAYSYRDIYLHRSEREKILQLLNSDRRDVVWLKASIIILNQSEEVGDILFGDTNFFGKEIEGIYHHLSQPLLKCCIQLLFRQQSYLCELPISGRRQGFGSKLLRYILVTQAEPFFLNSLDYFVRDVLTQGSTFQDQLSIWKTICRKHHSKYLLAEYLMYWCGKAKYHIKSAKAFWDVLLNSCTEEKYKDDIVNLLFKHIDILQLNEDSQFDLRDIIEPTILNRIVDKIDLDKMIISSIIQRENNVGNAKDLEKIDQEIAQQLGKYRKSTLKLRFLKQYLEKYVKQNVLHNDLKNVLSSFHLESREVIEEKLKKINITSFRNEKIEDWIM